MRTARAKLLIGGLIVTAAVGYLVYAGFKSGSSYYLTVDSFMVEPQYHDQRVRLRGKVGPDKLAIDGPGLKAEFHLLGETGGAHDLPVSYHGAIPDLFKAGADVVVEGKLGPGGVFQADKLFTKCPSKYDAKPAGPEKPS
jgi:cytochrome c-type biogenesis protein CcmE